MSFFQRKNNTNIDSEFKKTFSINVENVNKKKLLFIGIGIIFVIILTLAILLISNYKKENTVNIILKGNSIVTLYQNSDYNEMGAQGFNLKGTDLSNKIKISGFLGTSEIGEYDITYSLKNVIKKRHIIIKEIPEENVYIHLFGDLNYYLAVGKKYEEPGYLVFSTNGTNLKNKVIVSGIIDNNTPGVYPLIYSVVNSAGVTISNSRNIIVLKPNANLSLNNYNYTNGNVIIKADITDNYYDHLILPNGQTISSRNYNYEVSENGEYKFKLYYKNNISENLTIKVDRIDRQKPSGKCSAIYDSDSSKITVSASDNTSISGYIYNINGSKSNKISSSTYVANEKATSASVIIYDAAGNMSDVTCSLTEGNLSKPSSSSSSSKSSSSSSSLYNPPITDAKGIVSVDVTDLNCQWHHGLEDTLYSRFQFNAGVAESAKAILIDICNYVNENPWIGFASSAGSFAPDGYHGKGAAIDLFNKWAFTGPNGKLYKPYDSMGNGTWIRYKRLVCELCDGKEDCKYNINYQIWTRFFQPRGWCWGGNWGPSSYDPMHFEYRGGSNKCLTSKREAVTCD